MSEAPASKTPPKTPSATKASNDDDTAAAAKARRIKDKIAASNERSSGKAPPRKSAVAKRTPRATGDDRGFLARALDDHPLALLAGSVVLGAVAASLIPASFARRIGSRAFGLAALAGEMGALYGGKALEKGSQAARVGQDRLEDLGESAADYGSEARQKAIELGTLAARRAIDLASEAASNARGTGGGLVKRLGELADRARH